jgi:hypothetical protein
VTTHKHALQQHDYGVVNLIDVDSIQVAENYVFVKFQCLHEALSDSTASAWTRRSYSVSGIKSSKVTHAGRVSGVRLAELNGVSEDQVSKCLYLSLCILTIYRSVERVAGTQTR